MKCTQPTLVRYDYDLLFFRQTPFSNNSNYFVHGNQEDLYLLPAGWMLSIPGVQNGGMVMYRMVGRLMGLKSSCEA